MYNPLLTGSSTKPIYSTQFDQRLTVCVFTMLGGLIALPAPAQIIPDTTLGPESSIISEATIHGIPSAQIDGGAARASLLFHSFQEFNIDEGNGAYFSNPSHINTIFSRVTGSNPSSLLGTLGVLGSADLVFLNPNGVLFGPDSQLDIEGSFTATTASDIIFPSGEVFSATTPGIAPLLENNLVAPIGWVLEEQMSAPIISQGNLSAGQDLSLMANRISAQGELSAGENLTLQAKDLVQIRDSGERPFVAAAGNELTITGQNQVDIFALNHPQSLLASGGNMTLRSAAPVLGDAHYAAGGDFRVEDLAGELAPLISEVDPIIATANDVELGGYTGASLHILAGGQVRVTGDIEITGPDATATSIGPNAPAPFNQAIFREITLSDGKTTVSIDGSAQPTLDIRAGINWEPLLGAAPGNTNLFTTVNPNPTFGNAATSADINLDGNVRISAPDGLVYVSNQYVPNINLSGGDIQISDIITESLTGRGGDVIIDSRSDLIARGDVITTSSAEDSGNIITIAQDVTSLLNIVPNNVTIFSGSTRGPGRAGDINMTADSLVIKDGFQVVSNTFATGEAGDITVIARDAVDLDGTVILTTGNVIPSALASTVRQGATGNGGDITIQAPKLSLINGAQVFTQVLGEGDAGDVNIIAVDNVLIDSGNSSIESLIGSGIGPVGIGNGGDINITTQELIVINGAEIDSSTQPTGTGNVGDITIRNANTILLDNTSRISSLIKVDAIGNSGNVIFEDIGSLFVNNDSQIIVGARGEGNAGIISIDARDNIILKNESVISNFISPNGNGDNNGLQITTNSLQINGGSTISSFNEGQSGEVGDVSIIAKDIISLDGSGENGFPSAISSNIGLNTQTEGGAIELISPRLLMTNGATITSSTSGMGNAGNILIDAQESVLLDGVSENGILRTLIGSSTDTSAVGNAGSLSIETPFLSISNGAFLNSGTAGLGNSGNIDLTIHSLDVSQGGGISTVSLGTGDSGNINIAADKDITISGLLKIPAINSVSNSGITTAVLPGAIGDAGNIFLEANRLTMTDGSVISSDTFSEGNAGNISIKVDNSISLEQSLISSGVAPEGQGEGGGISVQGRNLNLTNGGQIAAGLARSRQDDIPSGQGEGGDIRIVVTDTVTIAGFNPGLPGFVSPFDPEAPNPVEGFPSGIITSTERGVVGPAGDIRIDTDSLRIRDGAVVTTATFNDSDAGDIFIDTENFEATGGGQVLTSTFEGGTAGEIRITANDAIRLSGSDPTFTSRLAQFGDDIVGRVDPESGIFSNTAADSTGNGGDIAVSAMSLAIDNGALLSVASLGEGNAGDINVNDTWVVQLDNQSGVLSQSTSGNGGNINFRNVDLLTLRQGSEVSTEAGLNSVGGGGNGGNINADIDFIFAVPSENSDIIANAFDGTGGNIFIVTEGISGLEFRPTLTRFSDITASSQFGVDGTVTIDTPGIDFARGFNPLPDAPRGTDITDTCEVSTNQDTVELFDIGQGGSIASPEDPLTADNGIDANWISLESLTNETTRNFPLVPEQTVNQANLDMLVTSSIVQPRQLITTCQRR